MILWLTFQVYTQEFVRSDKFKTGKEKYLDKKTLESEEREVYIGRLPVMINSDSCWMSRAEKDDCDFDQGGYFIIKGAEKVRTYCISLSFMFLVYFFNNPLQNIHKFRR